MSHPRPSDTIDLLIRLTDDQLLLADCGVGIVVNCVAKFVSRTGRRTRDRLYQLALKIVEIHAARLGQAAHLVLCGPNQYVLVACSRDVVSEDVSYIRLRVVNGVKEVSTVPVKHICGSSVLGPRVVSSVADHDRVGAHSRYSHSKFVARFRIGIMERPQQLVRRPGARPGADRQERAVFQGLVAQAAVPV